MADTEKLTLAVDIEIAKHDLLLDRFVAEIEKRTRAEDAKLSLNVSYDNLLQKKLTLETEHAATKRNLDMTCRDYDKQHRNLAERTAERDDVLTELRRLKEVIEPYFDHVVEHPRQVNARSKLRSAVSVALIRADQLLTKHDEIPF